MHCQAKKLACHAVFFSALLIERAKQSYDEGYAGQGERAYPGNDG